MQGWGQVMADRHARPQVSQAFVSGTCLISALMNFSKSCTRNIASSLFKIKLFFIHIAHLEVSLIDYEMKQEYSVVEI